MTKKRIVLIIVIAAALLVPAAVAFADTYSPWSDKYSGVQYQYVNGFGSQDWDGLRWYNGNSRRVEVTYTIKLRDGSKTNSVIYLESGATSAVSALAQGARVAAIAVK